MEYQVRWDREVGRRGQMEERTRLQMKKESQALGCLLRLVE